MTWNDRITVDSTVMGVVRKAGQRNVLAGRGLEISHCLEDILHGALLVVDESRSRVRVLPMN